MSYIVNCPPFSRRPARCTFLRLDEDYVQKANDPAAIVGRKVRVAKEEVEPSITLMKALGKRLFVDILSVVP